MNALEPRAEYRKKMLPKQYEAWTSYEHIIFPGVGPGHGSNISGKRTAFCAFRRPRDGLETWAQYRKAPPKKCETWTSDEHVILPGGGPGHDPKM